MATYGGRLCLQSVCGVLVAGALAGCDGNGLADDAPAHAPEVALVKSAEQALQGAHIPTVDPGTLNGAQIEKVLGVQALCLFRYTSTGRPVLAFGLQPDGSAGAGLVKLNGSLVPLQPDPAAPGRPGSVRLVAGPVRLHVMPRDEGGGLPAQGRQVEADMVFEVGQALTVGYGGYMGCRARPPAAMGGG